MSGWDTWDRKKVLPIWGWSLAKKMTMTLMTMRPGINWAPPNSKTQCLTLQMKKGLLLRIGEHQASATPWQIAGWIYHIIKSWRHHTSGQGLSQIPSSFIIMCWRVNAQKWAIVLTTGRWTRFPSATTLASTKSMKKKSLHNGRWAMLGAWIQVKSKHMVWPELGQPREEAAEAQFPCTSKSIVSQSALKCLWSWNNILFRNNDTSIPISSTTNVCTPVQPAPESLPPASIASLLTSPQTALTYIWSRRSLALPQHIAAKPWCTTAQLPCTGTLPQHALTLQWHAQALPPCIAAQPRCTTAPPWYSIALSQYADTPCQYLHSHWTDGTQWFKHWYEFFENEDQGHLSNIKVKIYPLFLQLLLTRTS